MCVMLSNSVAPQTLHKMRKLHGENSETATFSYEKFTVHRTAMTVIIR
jgi:hypothetical protein